MKLRRRTLVREINPHLICVLCSGYFIEATTIVECLHSFCRSCLVKYLEKSKFCPICDVQLHKNNPLLSVRCDSTLQQLVYKLIPGLYGREMARRRKYYSELGGPSSDPDCGEFPVGDAYFSPEDSISLSLEFVNCIKDEESSGSDSEEGAADKQAIHHRRYLQCPAAVTMSHLKKFLRMKYGLSHDHNVDIIYAGEILTDDFSLMDVAYTFSWNRASPMRFKFRLLQRNSMAQIVPNKDLVSVRDNGVSQAAKNESEGKKEAQLCPPATSAPVKRLSFHEGENNKVESSKPKKNGTENTNGHLKRSLVQEKTENREKEPADEPEIKKAKIAEPVVDKEKEERLLKKEKERLIYEEKVKKEKEKKEEERARREKEKEEKALRKEREKEKQTAEAAKNKQKDNRNYIHNNRNRVIEGDDDDIVEEVEEEVEEIEAMEVDEEEEERLQITTPEEDLVEEEQIEEEPIKEVRYVQSKSEERRKEKKKNKKAKHHHHHRHHDRKRDSPPAATILHSSENDIMKLKIKLTDINKPKYSVVDPNEDKKEIKENGYGHKHDKHSEKVDQKQKEEEAKKVVDAANNNKIDAVKTKNEILVKEKMPPIRQTIRQQKPSPSPPSPKMSPPPKPAASPKVCVSPKSQPIMPKQNGSVKAEPIKMPPSSITVSKITAAEKRQMEQQKLLMHRNNSNGVDSKRPSLEIMLVNAPKKASDCETKPVEVKKVIRPTPPSIPLSRLGKNVAFGPKSSPPPLVPATKASSHDESGALDLSGKSSRKSPDVESAMRNLVTLSDTAVHVRNMMSQEPPPTLKIPVPPAIGLNSKVPSLQMAYQNQRTIKPVPNQSVRQIPNPSALMFRQHNMNGRTVPPPGVPINSLRRIESMTKNIEKVAAGLSVKAAVEAGYAIK
ncbi:polycomb group protein Psc-like [Cimex lectularius]|uniref:RING-type domain-containing protein n=1 Tax=Cimex lectularius TaxID=79782 RepID=A0A8I6ST65_CIMLE|nr:polycomb group protein Psc-like [Cimex lectularius]